MAVESSVARADSLAERGAADAPHPPSPLDVERIAGLTLRNWTRLLIVLGLIVAVALPFFVKNFTVFQFSQVLVYAIAILGLNLLTGFNGQFSLGHSAFYAIGAYVAAILMFHFGWPYWTTLPFAGAVCLIAGFLFGLPALRLEGLYLALATFALAVATPQILKYKAIEQWTGGVQGINLKKPAPPFGLPLSKDQWLYYFCLLVGIVLVVCAWNLVRGRTGRAMVAIRDNPIAARTMGINTALYKSWTFGVSALYTGVAGALGAIIIQYVAPDSFTFFLAVAFLVGSVVGGIASIAGALVGGVFVMFVPNLSESVAVWLSTWTPVSEESAKGLTWTVYGVCLILIIYLMPSGAAGLVRLLVPRLVRR